jgi:hypothetical protein
VEAGGSDGSVVEPVAEPVVAPDPAGTGRESAGVGGAVGFLSQALRDITQAQSAIRAEGVFMTVPCGWAGGGQAWVASASYTGLQRAVPCLKRFTKVTMLSVGAGCVCAPSNVTGTGDQVAGPWARRVVDALSGRCNSFRGNVRQRTVFRSTGAYIGPSIHKGPSMNAPVAWDDAVDLLEQRVMKVSHVGYDAAARQLRLLSERLVLEDREQMVLRAGQAALGLRGMVWPLWR